MGEGSSPDRDSGAVRTPSGVGEMACSEGRLVNWGGSPAPVAKSRAAEACAGISREAKSRAAQRQSERGIVPVIGETTELVVGKAPHFGDVLAARGG